MSKHGFSVFLAATFFLWIRSTGESASPAVFFLLWGLIYAIVGMGDLAARVSGWSREVEGGVISSFVIGYVLISVLLFFLALALPFGLTLVASLAAAAVGVGHLFCRKLRPPVPETVQVRQPWADGTAVALAALAATIWTHELRSIVDPSSNPVVFKAWQDLFYHARLISMFGQSHGRETLSHISDASQPLAIYHYASYMLPAVVFKLGNVGSVNLYSSVLYPGAVLMGGLGAYTLVRSLFGAWPGVAALVAVLFAPDASFLGFGNKHQSYYFESLVNVAMQYGLAGLALSWAIMIRACKNGSYKQVVLAYLLGFLLVFIKAHLFFANSFLLMLYPVVMFPGVRVGVRVGIALAFTSVFLAAFLVLQQFDGVPSVVLDGSGVHVHFRNMNHYTPGGELKDMWKTLYYHYRGSALVYPLGAVYIIAYSLGMVFLAFCLALFYARRRKMDAHAGWVLLVFLLWLFYSLFLSPDTRQVGTMDELIHRPFVWAYYIMAAWSAGVLYRSWVGDTLPVTVWGRAGCGLLLGVMVGFAVAQSINAQVFPVWREGGYRTILAFDRCALDAAHYLRSHRSPGQLFQSSDLDRKYFFTAQSETQIYAGGSVYGPTRSAPREKLEAVAGFMAMDNEADVIDYVRRTHLNWFLREPQNALMWPESLARYQVFECGGFQLYRFDLLAP